MTNPSLHPSATGGPSSTAASTPWLKQLVLRQLHTLRHGHLLIHTDGQSLSFGDKTNPLQAQISVQHGSFWAMVAGNGSTGAAEAYVQGYWSSPDLTLVMRLFAANLELLDNVENGLARLRRPLIKALHWFNRNTRDGSRRNISAHYDLGNALFEQLLDPTMMYSSAIFRSADDTLEQGQLNKLQRICQKLELKASDHLLEIGTGWGSMALYAATHYGCKVTTTTLSQQQYAYTQKRIEEQGLQDRITLLLEDYRDLKGQYDKLVSIEMIEAVGHRFLPTYFKQCSHLLKDGGLMLLQAITMRDQRYAQAKKSVDFIQRYIFPGGALPSVTAMLNCINTHTDMNLHHMEDFGLHYARTLRFWHENLRRSRSTLEVLGYDETFYRLWEFYFCYCEGGFLERSIGTTHLLLAKPSARPQPFGISG